MSHEGPIIFVDDDDDDQFIYREVCQRLGVPNPLRFFDHARKALEYLKETSEKPFVIFCDINMPEIDGIRFRQRIYDDPQLRKKSIPFIFYSTAASKDQVEKAYEFTVQGFFIKAQDLTSVEATFKMIFDYWLKCRHPNSPGASGKG